MKAISDKICNRHPSWLHVIASEDSYCVMTTGRGEMEMSASPYDGFNLCHYTGDDPDHVKTCRNLLASAIGVEPDRIVVPRQTHSVNVAVIDSLPIDMEELEDVDGIVTTLRGVAIGVSTADCVPVILVDEVVGVIGAFHAGWRGAVGGIVENGVGRMVELGASAGRIRAFVGPAICVNCFEVGDEVASRFPEECVVRYDDGRRPHVDLPGYVMHVLRNAGVSSCNIEPFSYECCTRCHPSRYFSARAIGVDSGRNFTFVMLR
ncbi:MAG: polyphenol oxidase family protein [Bacteroides sp.]|nr:polyphenol oxidase family protein [Bacteroides sp.]